MSVANAEVRVVLRHEPCHSLKLKVFAKSSAFLRPHLVDIKRKTLSLIPSLRAGRRSDRPLQFSSGFEGTSRLRTTLIHLNH